MAAVRKVRTTNLNVWYEKELFDPIMGWRPTGDQYDTIVKAQNDIAGPEERIVRCYRHSVQRVPVDRARIAR